MEEDINWNLLHHYLSGECTVQEEEQIREWMAQDAEHQIFIQKLKEAWDIKPLHDIKLDANDGWEKISQRLDIKDLCLNENLTKKKDAGSGNRRTSSKKTNIWDIFFKVAACILITAMGLFVYFHYSAQRSGQTSKTAVDMQQVSTGKGEHSTIRFSDGTRVTLNAASSVRFPKEFTKNKRIVYLKGEAYFEVAHLPNNAAFIVQTNQARVKVHGTKFNVMAWKKDQRVRVVVKDGAVSVRSKKAKANNEVFLTKGQYSVVNDGEIPSMPAIANVAKYLGWLQGTIIFEHTPFSKVIERLGRTFDVHFKIIDSTLLQTPFTSRFDHDSLNKILKIISKTMDLEFSRNGQEVIVNQK